MTNLLSSLNLPWAIALFIICALIIFFATYALRREICAAIKRFFMPQEQRYALHSRIISKTESNASKNDSANSQNTAPPQHGTNTIIYNAQFNSNLSQEKPDKSVFEVLSVLSRWYYRKISRKMKYFRKQNSNIKTNEIVNVKNEKSSISDFPNTPAPQKIEPSERLKPGDNLMPKDTSARNYSKKQYSNKLFKLIANERFIFIIILSLMFVAITFLLIKVNKLSRAVEKQNAYIENVQKRTAVKRVIIHDIPASRIPLSKKKI
jgi:hypothetical protein